ncbi:hypothetical protein [Streptomyces sp. NPDC016845]|uniref:TRADD-N-associated membrane domain-containing protein n=1 Tax=Streptomyces sp. NPDC016845 TaxID=3364972 RepID=UPI0037A02684
MEKAEEQLEAAIAAPISVRFASEEARKAFEEIVRAGRDDPEKAHDEGTSTRAREAQRRLLREEAAERAQLALAKLWGVTHARLRDYHGIALGQAKRSFWTAQGAMITGFLFLVGFAIVALKADNTAASAAAAVLGTVAAALAGFVSRTFIRSQEAAAAHLQRYFDQPLEFSRYLAAERLINDADLTREERAAAVAKLVDAMISGPFSEAPAAVEGKSATQADSEAPAT